MAEVKRDQDEEKVDLSPVRKNKSKKVDSKDHEPYAKTIKHMKELLAKKSAPM